MSEPPSEEDAALIERARVVLLRSEKLGNLATKTELLDLVGRLASRLKTALRNEAMTAKVNADFGPADKALMAEVARLRARIAQLESASLSGVWAKIAPHMRWARVQRMRFIAHRVETFGKVNRSDLMQKFGISQPQASIDLSDFRRLNPGIIEYDASAKCFRALNPSHETEKES